MLNLIFNLPADRPPCFLFIGAHCDDIEIGCGGTVVELLRQYPEAHVHWVVLSSEGPRKQEAKRAASTLLRGIRHRNVLVKEFRGSYFPSEVPSIKDFFEELKASVTPDVIFTHYRQDLHQDHRVVNELTWNTFRNHTILEYEIPKYDGDLGCPSVYMPLTSTAVKRKIDVLMKVFATQHSKHWFTPDLFQGLMRLRGMECNANSGFAEAFYMRKILLKNST